jgi:hypothetical protein
VKELLDQAFARHPDGFGDFVSMVLRVPNIFPKTQAPPISSNCRKSLGRVTGAMAYPAFLAVAGL